jgi:hypothetical protein
VFNKSCSRLLSTIETDSQPTEAARINWHVSVLTVAEQAGLLLFSLSGLPGDFTFTTNEKPAIFAMFLGFDHLATVKAFFGIRFVLVEFL